VSQTIAGAPRSNWADDWDPAPPHPRPAATARTVAAGAPSSAGEAAAPARRRVAWRALGTGVLPAAGSLVAAAVAVLLVAFLFLAASGRDALRLGHGTPAELLLAAGFGLAAAATLLVLARARPLTLAPAALLPAAAWLSGHPLPALLATTLPTGLAIALDRARPPHPTPARSSSRRPHSRPPPRRA
jgi:hypothetical protein